MFVFSSQDGQTALKMAFEEGHTESVKCLVDAGASPDVLHYAAGRWVLHKLSGWLQSFRECIRPQYEELSHNKED